MPRVSGARPASSPTFRTGHGWCLHHRLADPDGHGLDVWCRHHHIEDVFRDAKRPPEWRWRMAATPLERTPGCHARLCPSTPTARGLYLGGATRCRPRRGRRRTAWPSSRPPSGKGSSGCGTTSTTGPPAAGNRQYAASPSNAADYGTEIGLGHDRVISQCPFVLRARPRRESVVRGDLRHATTARCRARLAHRAGYRATAFPRSTRHLPSYPSPSLRRPMHCWAEVEPTKSEWP